MTFTVRELEAMAIDIVDVPITNGDFPLRYVSLPEGKYKPINIYPMNIPVKYITIKPLFLWVKLP